MNINKIKGYSFAIFSLFTSILGSVYTLFPCFILIFINKPLFHKVAEAHVKLWCELTCFFLERILKINIHMHLKNDINKNNKSTNTIIIMNHRTRLDWWFYLCVLYRLNGLDYIKVMLKKELKNIWGAGWAIQCALFISVSRKWEKDSQAITNIVDYYKELDKNVWILIFPEGTNLTQNTKEKSDEFAKKNNVETYEHVLHPRVTGFIHLYNEMKRNSMIDYIHDVTVAYDSPTESEKEFFNGKIPKHIHYYIESIDCKTATINDDWLIERWKLKEKFLNEIQNNSFETNEYKESSNLTQSLNIRLYCCVIFSMLYIAIALTLLYYFLIIKIYCIISIVIMHLINKYYDGIDNFLLLEQHNHHKYN